MILCHCGQWGTGPPADMNLHGLFCPGSWLAFSYATDTTSTRYGTALALSLSSWIPPPVATTMVRDQTNTRSRYFSHLLQTGKSWAVDAWRPPRQHSTHKTSYRKTNRTLPYFCRTHFGKAAYEARRMPITVIFRNSGLWREAFPCPEDNGQRTNAANACLARDASDTPGLKIHPVVAVRSREIYHLAGPWRVSEL